MNRLLLNIFVFIVGIVGTTMMAVEVEPPHFIPRVQVEVPVIIDTLSLSRLGVKGSVEQVIELSFVVRSDGDSVKYVRVAGMNDVGNEDKEGTFETDDWSRKSNFLAEFRPDGNISDYVLLWSDRKPKEINKYEYDSSNRLTEHTQFMYFSDATLANVSYFRYAGKSMNPSTVAREHDGYLMDSKAYEYNGAGCLTKVVERDSDGNVESTKVYNYSDCGLIFHKDKDCDDESSETYVYDSNCRVIETRYTWGDDLYFSIYYTYNDDGLITKIVETRNSEPLYTKFFSYSDGRLVSMKYDHPGAGKYFTETYEYDGSRVTITKNGSEGTFRTIFEDGNIVLIDTDHGTFIYDYKFDAGGNWTEIVEYLNGTARYGRRRIIKYF